MHEQNYLMYIQGLYNTRATMVAVDKCFNGKKSKAEYFEEPIRIFPLTEEEKKKEQEKELQKFINLANSMVKDDKNKS